MTSTASDSLWILKKKLNIVEIYNHGVDLQSS